MGRTTKTLAKKEPQPLANPAPTIDPETLEKALIGGDLGALNPAQRMQYLTAVCSSLRLNMLTRPLEFTTIDGKLMLYARKDCTEQLRNRDTITVKIIERKSEDGVYSVTARAFVPNGREDESIGAVPMIEPTTVTEWDNRERKKVRVPNAYAGKPLSAADRAKAMMLAETKAKRRVTLSIAGLGIPDESELEQHFESAPPSSSASDQAASVESIKKAGGDVLVIDVSKAKEVLEGKESKTIITNEKGEDARTVILEPTEEDRAAKAEGTNAEIEKLLDVKCHIGNAGGPWLEVPIRDMRPKALKALWDEVIVKMPEKPVLKEQRLRDAVKARKALMEADGTWPKDAPEAPQTPPEAQTTAPEPEKGRKGAKRAKAEASSEPPKFNWRDVIIPMGAAQGKKLSELSDRMTELYCYGLPLATADQEDFVKGVTAAMGELGLMTDENARKMQFLTRCVDGIDQTLKGIGVALVAAGILTNGRTKVSELTDVEIENHLEYWDDLMDAVRKSKEDK